MTERHGAILAELSELNLSLARKVHEDGMAATTPADVRDLTLALHRLSRSVRQTLALEARLQRDRQRLAHEAAREGERQTVTRVQRRKAQVRAAVERLIWTEAEGDEAEHLLDDLDDRLDAEALDEAFAAESLETHIARLQADLGLGGAGEAAPADPPDWRLDPEAWATGADLRPPPDST